MKIFMAMIFLFGTIGYSPCLQAPGNLQDPTKSLVDIAKETKQKRQNQPQQAKNTFTDDTYMGRSPRLDLPQKSGEGNQIVSLEIPEIDFEGPDNSDQILEKLRTLKKNRGSAAAAAALHSWYDKYDGMLQDGLLKMNALQAKKKTTELSLAENVEALRLVGITLQIEGHFLGVFVEAKRLGLDVDWFKFRCFDGSTGDCH